MSKRLARLTLIFATAAGLAAATGTASANPSDTAVGHRSNAAPSTAGTNGDDHRPAGVGQGRKVV